MLRLLILSMAIASPVYANMCCQGMYATMPLDDSCPTPVELPASSNSSSNINTHIECTGVCCASLFRAVIHGEVIIGFHVECVPNASYFLQEMHILNSYFQQNNLTSNTLAEECLIFEPQSFNISTFLMGLDKPSSGNTHRALLVPVLIFALVLPLLANINSR